MTRPDATWRILPVAVLLALGLVACTGSDDPPADGGTATTEEESPTAAATTSTPSPVPDPTSAITIGPVDPPLSDAEIRVGEIIVEFDGEVTDEGTVLTLEEPILFDFDSSELKSSSGEALDEIAEVLAYYEDAPVVVAGHTDSRGSDEYNLNLSQERADAVTGALADRDIDRDRMTSEGRGSTEPVAPNENDDGSDNPEGRAQNRRVEVLIVGVEPPDPDA